MEEKIIEYLDKLADAIETVSPVVWEAYIKQQYVYAASIFFGFLCSLMIMAIGIRIYHKRPRWALDNFDKNYGSRVILFAGTAFSLLFFIMIFLVALPLLYNPTYYAIQELLP
jgi:hypothetical protein